MKIFSVLALSAFTFLAACAVSPTDDASNPEGSAEDLSAGKAQLTGSWVRAAGQFGGFGSKGLYLGPDGQFFQDTQGILLGVMTSPPKDQRSTGTYTVNASKKTITLDYAHGSDKVTYHYDFTPAHILLGVFAPGTGPTPGVAKLALTRQVTSEGGPATSQIAFPTEIYELAPSYCAADADCDLERADRTWEPSSDGKSECKVNVCTVAE
jgi:hypothetical protein